jgi:hypothetical protein
MSTPPRVVAASAGVAVTKFPKIAAAVAAPVTIARARRRAFLLCFKVLLSTMGRNWGN